MSDDSIRGDRREFLGRLGVAAAATAAAGAGLAPRDATAAIDPRHNSPWDMSWVDKLTGVPYKVAFDANNIADGLAPNLAADFMTQYHEVYNTRDDQTRAVIVMRQLGVQMAFGDALWDKYAIGEDVKVSDPATKAPAKRNVFWREAAGSNATPDPSMLDSLHARGAIFLACNRAAMNWSRRMAEKNHRSVEEVQAEVRAGLIPGALLMPSGIFAMIRAQNAGCAYMRGA
ncbi:MAG: hypothetical protein M3081_13635 [Gemmatimonadota bacterium]|nr:hypothetical protein [Gemmatimonadota bacterium]